MTHALRPEVQRFAEAMQRKLDEHDRDKGDTWRDAKPSWLIRRLKAEVNELQRASKTVDADTVHRVVKEAADVGNFAMFVAEVLVSRTARLSAPRPRP